MKALLALACALLIGFCLLGVQAMNGRQNTQQRTGLPEDARRLWEQAIAAKGGRARLYSVRNMLLTVTGRNYRSVSLYVFPNKLWGWSDEPEPFGRSATMLNLERNIGYETYPDDAESPRRMNERWRNSTALALRDVQLLYLLETRWVRPEPIGVASGRVEWRAVDIVQTVVDGKRVDFYLDRESHLPLKISFPDERGTYYVYVTFSDYREVDGIQMPRRVSCMGGGWILTKYQLNVAYDEAIFERPPSIEAGPEAWRARRE